MFFFPPLWFQVETLQQLSDEFPWMNVQYRNSWSPEDESYWLLAPPAGQSFHLHLNIHYRRKIFYGHSQSPHNEFYWLWWLFCHHWFCVTHLHNYSKDCHEICWNIHFLLRMNCKHFEDPFTFPLTRNLVLFFVYAQLPAKSSKH